MISHFTKSLTITRNLIKTASVKFSTNPTPNQNPKDDKNRPQLNNKTLNKSQSKLSQSLNPISRAQAKLKVSRAQLAKYAKIQLDYEKLHLHTQKIQIAAKYLQQQGFKIRPYPEYGTRLNFYRTVTIKKKPTPKPKQQGQNKQNDQQNKKQKFQQQQFEPDQEEWQVQVLTSAQKQFESKQQSKRLDNYYNFFKPQKQEQQKQEDQNLDILLGGPKKSKDSIISAFRKIKVFFSQEEVKNMKQNEEVQKVKQNEEVEKVKYNSSFKQMNVYVRNVNSNEAPQKWIKIQLMLQDFKTFHFFKISIINKMENEVQGVSMPHTQYEGVQANQLEPELVNSIKQLLQQDEYLTPHTLKTIYYYTAYHEAQYYRKWLQDLIDLAK